MVQTLSRFLAMRLESGDRVNDLTSDFIYLKNAMVLRKNIGRVNLPGSSSRVPRVSYMNETSCHSV